MKRRESVPLWVLFAVGGVVSAISLYVIWFTNSENKASMKLFAFIGIVFLVFAVIKFIIRQVSSSNPAHSERELAQRLSGADRIEKEDKKITQDIKRIEKQQDAINEVSIIKCPVCQTKNYNTSNYCHICGYKLRQ